MCSDNIWKTPPQSASRTAPPRKRRGANGVRYYCGTRGANGEFRVLGCPCNYEVRKFEEASKTRRTSDDRRECTMKYTTKAERCSTQYCVAYSSFSGVYCYSFTLRETPLPMGRIVVDNSESCVTAERYSLTCSTSIRLFGGTGRSPVT